VVLSTKRHANQKRDAAILIHYHFSVFRRDVGELADGHRVHNT
jgi:hypothetical protein